MLAGRSGHWVNGHEIPWPIELKDTIAHSPIGAELTKHGIVVDFWGGWLQGSWHLTGGLIDRTELRIATLELFGKEIVREHWPEYVKLDEDYRYEFFLVMRPRAGGVARVLRKWTFPPEEVALAVLPATAARIRELAKSEEEAVKRIKSQRSHYLVGGRLRTEADQRTVVVTISGMVRPVEERVDVSSPQP
jgi:hypothetical protein